MLHQCVCAGLAERSHPHFFHAQALCKRFQMRAALHTGANDQQLAIRVWRQQLRGQQRHRSGATRRHRRSIQHAQTFAIDGIKNHHIALNRRQLTRGIVSDKGDQLGDGELLVRSGHDKQTAAAVQGLHQAWRHIH